MTPDVLRAQARRDRVPVEDIERALAGQGLDLPDDYLAFLAEYGGVQMPGPPFTYAFSDGEGILVNYLVGPDSLEVYGETYAFGHVVIGASLMGDEIVLVTEPGPHRGAVYMWLEEESGLFEEPDDWSDELAELDAAGQLALLDEHELWDRVGDTFTAFLASLKPSSD